MSEAETDRIGADLRPDQPPVVKMPVLLWEGRAALFSAPDGGRVIRYETNDGEQFVAIPAELVPALEMLRANPGALVAISQSPMGGMARKMVGQFTRKAAAAGAG